ncbi:ABC transporter substrate-binding protein [Acuticoccus sp.]|uniref:ABC transporter substrate-binding protein n=1 Tax=Acuticoccus sp. TaxID=1904378 RepID=UPI003B52B746
MEGWVRAACAAIAVAAAAAPSSEARAATIAISCSALGTELRLCREGAEAWAAETGHEVTLVSTPNSATERLALYLQILSAGADDIDVYQIDVIWPGLLADHLLDLAPHMDGAQTAHVDAMVEAATVDGELKAMPWFADAGVLYYRADLLEAYGLEPPRTWDALEAAARTVMDGERAKGDDDLWGYVFQGRAYEGLTVNALEWIASHGGGTIVADDGTVTVNNARAAEALATAAGWIGTIAPEGVLNYAEEEARGLFQSGNAVFMRNWPYAYALADGEGSPVRGRVGVAVLPKGGDDGRHTGTLGGQLLAVSRYSRHPEIAADLVRHLTSADEQRRRALEGAFNPTVAALLEDEELNAALPFLDDLSDTFANAVARPSSVTGEHYNRVSNAFWNAVHDVLSGSTAAGPALAELERTLARIRRRGW